MRPPLRLIDTYRFPDFRPSATVRGVFGDPRARILRLARRGKKHDAAFATQRHGRFTTTRSSGARPLLWRHAGLPGDRGPARVVSALWGREARAAALAGRQSLLYQT